METPQHASIVYIYRGRGRAASAAAGAIPAAAAISMVLCAGTLSRSGSGAAHESTIAIILRERTGVSAAAR
jgi:hypothetical protein